jgi:hypothetical protein
MPDAELMTGPVSEDSSPVPAVGVVIGERYVVEGFLGRGGMSVVLRARDLRLGHLVALKVLQRSSDRRSEHARRFLREARIIAKLRSDHVVSVLDVDTASEPPYLAMELLEGQTVAALLAAHGRFAPDVALRIVAQACRGVADAHALGVMHRDLKPSNLIVARAADGGQRVKVIDFGISKPILGSSTQPELTSTGEILGSPRYMSPEQVRAGGTIDARSDIWALGAILYELIAGVSPFNAPTVADTLARIVRDTPMPLRECAPEASGRVASIVALCLSKDPALRPPDVRTLLDELEAVTPPGPLTIDELPAAGHARTWGATTQRTGDRSWSVVRGASPQRPSRLGILGAIAIAAALAGWLGLRVAGGASVPPRAPSAASTGAPAAPVVGSAPELAVSREDGVARSETAPSAAPAVVRDSRAGSRAPGPSRVRPRAGDAGVGDEDLELNRRE